MDRIIKFRGKRIDNGEWITGDFYFFEGANIRHYHQTCRHDEGLQNSYTDYEVIPETVGQFTTHELGLYVGDIVNYITGNPSRQVNAVVEFGEYKTYTHFNKEEGDVENHIGFYINDGKSKMPLRSLWLVKIGNIHDNPELNPLQRSSVTNTMEPNNKQQEEQHAAGEAVAAEAQNAQESASQDQAMEATQENAEEGTTEG